MLKILHMLLSTAHKVTNCGQNLSSVHPNTVLLLSGVSLSEPLSSEPEAELPQLFILIHQVTTHALCGSTFISVLPHPQVNFHPVMLALCSMLPAPNYA